MVVDSGHRPLVKPPKRTFKTVLSMDGGALRNIISTVVLVEVEHSIKRYLLAHPELLPKHVPVHSAEDFDVELVDYFDLITGFSAGGWMSLYIASRGGHGIARRVLDDPAIVEKYGFIATGSAEGLIVFFNEFGNVIYPSRSIDNSAGASRPLFTNDGVLEAMEAFVGNLTMADLDSSVIVPAFDTISGFNIVFVKNAFGDIPVTSSAKMLSRFSPRAAGRSFFTPDLQFDEGANYYLKGVAAAAGAVPIVNPAMPVSRVDNDTMEFLCVDSACSVDPLILFPGFFGASENGFENFKEIAIMSLGAGQALSDWTMLANAGLADWVQGFFFTRILFYSGRVTDNSLLDYVYYSNPDTKPYQFLRIDRAASTNTEEGVALLRSVNSSFVDANQAFGLKTAMEHRQSIDIFVRDFLFG